MGARTRSAANSPTKLPGTTKRSALTSEQPQEPSPQVLIVPRTVSSEARILRLKHPRDGCMASFIFCPENGLLEFTRVMSEVTDPRSILFCLPNMDDSENNIPPQLESRISAGYIRENADILTATPFDITWILLGKLVVDGVSTKKGMFQPLDDLLDSPESEDKNLHYILKHAQPIVEAAMTNICDVVEAGDEKLYRYSEDKLLHLWIHRAQQVVLKGLPASMEDHFVTRALEIPVLSIRREDLGTGTPSTTNDTGRPSSDSNDSQSTVTSTTSSIIFSEISDATSATTVAEDLQMVEARRLLRLRVALNFISATCLPKHLSARLHGKLTVQGTPISFKTLDAELDRIASLKAAAQASRSLTDFSRKRTSAEDEEAAEMRAEKKRKLEEDEKKRKATESRGVRDLKKVNVSGMKKMSDFFSKKQVTTKAKS